LKIIAACKINLGKIELIQQVVEMVGSIFDIPRSKFQLKFFCRETSTISSQLFFEVQLLQCGLPY